MRKSAMRRRLPRTDAVSVTVASVGGAEAPKVADVMRRMREGVPSVTATFGIKEIRPKRLANGGMLLEIPGAQSASQADALAKHIRNVFPEGSGVRVSHLVRKVDLRLTGFDESFTPKEIAMAVSGYGGGCDADQVQVGLIRTSRRGDICTVWVQACYGGGSTRRGGEDNAGRLGAGTSGPA